MAKTSTLQPAGESESGLRWPGLAKGPKADIERMSGTGKADIRSADITIDLRGPYWREQRNAQNLRSRFLSLSGLGTVTGRASLV